MRPVRFTYQTLNIKLLSNKRSGTAAYNQILEAIFSESISKPTSRGKRVILRTMFPAELDGKRFFYGKISRFTDLENQDWLNIRTKEIENPELDENLFPNLQETDYVFVPQAHRFIIRKSPSFTIHNAEDFFKSALRDVIDIDEDYHVVIEQSEDIFEEIYNAQRVERLCITISYTNSDDIGDDAAEWMDEELKDGMISKAFMHFESDHNKDINLDTKLVKGSLALAKDNGEVEATVIGLDNRKKKIITKKHPAEIKTVAPSEEKIKNTVFTEILRKYRNGGQQSN